MAGGQDDPFLWDTDRLAQEFSSSRLSSTLTPGRKLPDLNNLAAKIREQELDGQTLLTYEDELGIAGLWEDLDIKKPPHKLSVNELIRHLKKRSPKYDEWKTILLDGSPMAPRPNEEGPEHIFGNVPAPVFAGVPNGGISEHNDVSREPWSPIKVPLASPGVGSVFPATQLGPSGEDRMDNPRADSPTPDGPRLKKRKIAPIILSSTPLNQFAAPVETMADTTTFGRVMDRFSTPFSGSPGYLGLTTLFADSIAQPPIPDSLEEVDDGQEFSWVKSKAIPPGRSVQVCKKMNWFLRKGTFANNSVDAESGTGSIVPFGESDEEQEYDSELEEELNEAEEKMEQEQSSKSHLTQDMVKEVIDNAIETLRTTWVEKKKPLRDRTAWTVWHKARRQGTRQHKIGQEEARVEELDKRIADITKEIMKTRWVNSDGLLDKASLWLDVSVVDQMESQWLIRLLQSHRPPPKPSKLPKLKLKPKKKPVDLGEDEEILTDDEFVIDDEDNGDGDPMEVDSNHYSDEDVPLADRPERAPSPASTPEPIDVDPRETPDRAVKSENKMPVFSTPRKPLVSSDVIEIQSTPIKKLDQVPELEDVETIGEIGMAYWTEFKDPERLVVAILFQQSPVRRSDIYKLISEHDPGEIWDTKIEKEIAAVFHAQPILNAVEFELAKLFDAFFSMTHNRMHLTRFPRVRWHKYKGHKSAFVRFCNLLKRILPRFLLPPTPRTPIATSRALSPVAAMAGQGANASEETDDSRSTPNSTLDDAEPTETADASEEDIDEDLGSTSDSSENMMPSSSGKKKRPPRQDKKAQEIRDATLKQTEEFEKRRKQLRDRLAQTGSVPSDKTRLIVNETKASDELPLIYINENIGRRIKDHQIEGVRFMWNMLTVNPEAQSGGLLAHAMGLGKTMQVITLLVVIAESARSPDPLVRSQIPEHLRESKTLIICPAGLVENWTDELLSWAPKDLLGGIVRVVADVPENQRPGLIHKWASNGGVLVIGMTLFTSMFTNIRELADVLLNTPSIVICDEAHLVKNPNSGRAKATKAFKTRCRIALTGSPLTKDVGDYYAMIDWVAPGYLADHAEFAQRFQKPIKMGLYMDSDKYAQRRARKQLHVLKALVEPKVHRKDVDVLRHELPKKMEFILTVPMTPTQMRTYNKYLEARHRSGETQGQAHNWSFAANMGRLLAHPRIFKIHLEKQKKQREAAAKAARRGETPPTPPTQTEDDVGLTDGLLSEVFATLTDREIEDHALSNKMKMLIAILDECKRIGEKVLVFSQSLDTLDYLESMFNAQGRVYQRMDGATNINERQHAVKKFNSDESFAVYLISTKAGGVGFNIHGASRVVIFDFKYTPADEQQAIGRAYRIGQTKPVYVYWLTVGGTFEDAIRNKTVFKTQLASRVVDKKNPLPRSKKAHDFFFDPTIPEKQDLSQVPKMDPVLDSLVQRFGSPDDDDCILRKVTFTETFEEEEVFELTAEDKLEAEQDIQAARLRINNPEEYKRREQEKLAGMRPEPGTVQFGGSPINSPASECPNRTNRPAADGKRLIIKLKVPPHLRMSLKQTTVTPNAAATAALEEDAGSSSLDGSAVAGVAGVAGVKGPAVTANKNMLPVTLPSIRPVNEVPPSTAPTPGLFIGNALVSPDRVFGSRVPPSTQPAAASGKLEWNGIIQPQSPGSLNRGTPILAVAKKSLEPMLGKHTQYKETPVPVPVIPPVSPVVSLSSQLGVKEFRHILEMLETRTNQLRKTGHKPIFDHTQLATAITDAMESRNLEGLPKVDRLQNLEKHVREHPRFADALLSGHLEIGSAMGMDRNAMEQKSKDYNSMPEADFVKAAWRTQGTSEVCSNSQQPPTGNQSTDNPGPTATAGKLEVDNTQDDSTQVDSAQVDGTEANNAHVQHENGGSTGC